MYIYANKKAHAHARMLSVESSGNTNQQKEDGGLRGSPIVGGGGFRNNILHPSTQDKERREQSGILMVEGQPTAFYKSDL